MDFLALFAPAGKTQGPKLRAAIRSLRLVHECAKHGSKFESVLRYGSKPGLLVKEERQKQGLINVERNPLIAPVLDNPSSPFNIHNLAMQIVEECVWDPGYTDHSPDHKKWGGTMLEH